MKIKILLLSLFLSGMCITACEMDPGPGCDAVLQRIQKDQGKAQKPLYIVLCDFSASMDTQSVRFVWKKALTIYDENYNNAYIKFYPVTKASMMPIFESGVWAVTDTGSISGPDYNALSHCLDSLKATERETLNSVLEKEASHRPDATYIIRSLQNAIRTITVADPRHTRQNRIYILSDMLESGTSDWGRINLENHLKEGLDSMENAPDSTVQPAIDPFIEIKLAYFTQRYTGSELQKFWRLVFRHLGYSKEVIFSSEL